MSPGWFFILLLVCSAGFAQQPPASGSERPKLTVDNIKQQTQILSDPTIALDNAKRVLLKQPADAPPTGPITLDSEGQRIDDPTQMTGSFSQALKRINKAPGQSSAAPASLAIPSISLVAKAICHHDNKSAMLNVAGKTRLVKPGNKFTVIDGGQLYEIEVDKIETDHVVITVLPTAMQIILQ
ncbi:MAG: hypothetical protein Kow0065_03760 [Methylomicrobium sp.]